MISTCQVLIKKITTSKKANTKVFPPYKLKQESVSTKCKTKNISTANILKIPKPRLTQNVLVTKADKSPTKHMLESDITKHKTHLYSKKTPRLFFHNRLTKKLQNNSSQRSCQSPPET